MSGFCDLNSNAFKRWKAKIDSKWTQCVSISLYASWWLKIRSKSSISWTIFSTADFQREICSLLPHFAGLFHACVSFELSLTVNTLGVWMGEWREGVCTLFVQREKLFSWDASRRFACIRAAEGKSNPFLSSGEPRAHIHKKRTHAPRRISTVKVIRKTGNTDFRPGELINVNKKFTVIWLQKLIVAPLLFITREHQKRFCWYLKHDLRVAPSSHLSPFFSSITHIMQINERESQRLLSKKHNMLTALPCSQCVKVFLCSQELTG